MCEFLSPSEGTLTIVLYTLQSFSFSLPYCTASDMLIVELNTVQLYVVYLCIYICCLNSDDSKPHPSYLFEKLTKI